MRRTLSSLALPLVAALSLAACPSGEPPADDDDSTEVDVCADSLAPGTVQVFATGLTGGTEGIAFSPSGRLFVSRGDVVEEVFPDGQHEEIAQIPAEVGLAWWNGELLVASGDSGEPDGLGGVYAVDVDSGAVRLLAGGISGANFPAVTPWGTLLVSTPSGDEEIVEVTADGDVTLWSSEVPSPNGIGFSADGSAAYVATTFANPAPLWEVPIVDGVAQTPSELASWGPGTAPDGVAMGASGAVYIAQNIAGRVDRVDPATGTETAVGEGVQFAASLAFGVGESWDPCAVYVTSLFSDELYVVGVGEAGLSL